MHPERTPPRTRFEKTGHPGVYKHGRRYRYAFYRNGRNHWGAADTLKDAIRGKQRAQAGLDPEGADTARPVARARHKDLLAMQARHWQRLIEGPWVYFLVAPNAGMVKIGMTGQLVQRCRTIQAHAPELLTLALVVHDDGGLEAELHERFKDARKASEWFVLTDEITDEILHLSAHVVHFPGNTGTPEGQNVR